MITRSNLAEQLRDHQLRSQHNWALLSFFWPTAPIASRGDAAKAALLGLLFLLLLAFSFTALYLRYTWISLFLMFLAILLPTCLRIVRQATLARRRQRRMLLPLSITLCIILCGAPKKPGLSPSISESTSLLLS